MKMQISLDVPNEIGADLLPKLIVAIRDAQPDLWRLDVVASRPEPLLGTKAEKITVGDGFDGSDFDKQAASLGSNSVEVN